MSNPSKPYHHGDLRQAILDAAAAAVGRDGVASLSLRSLAQQVGVSHTAPRHHFGDKRGVLTALAAQGYEALAADLRRAGSRGDFLDVGVEYVAWAIDHPEHYQVMFRPDLVDETDADYATAIRGLRRTLVESLREGRDLDEAERDGDGETDALPILGLAAWSIVHGFVTLALAGSLPIAQDDRREATLTLARATLARLDVSGRDGAHHPRG